MVQREYWNKILVKHAMNVKAARPISMICNVFHSELYSALYSSASLFLHMDTPFSNLMSSKVGRWSVWDEACSGDVHTILNSLM
jgi:hypothetical protein